MTTIHMLVREIRHAKVNTFLCLAAVTIACGLLVAMVAVSRASVDATRILMKNMGFNLLITPQGVDPARYQALDFQDADMPESYVAQLAKSTILAQHFVGKYQQTIQIDGRTVVLTGVLPEVAGRGEKKPLPTAYDVPRGNVYLGFAAARVLGAAEGDSVTVMNQLFNVKRVLPEVGVIPDDIRVYAHLHDVQSLLGRPGRINAIDALACQCPVNAKDIVDALRRGIQEILPDVEVKPYESILLARHKTRGMIALLASITLAVVVGAAALSIWGLTWQNIRNRRREIGTLSALGIPSRRIVTLFVGKIIAYSFVGAVSGGLLGYGLAANMQMVEAPVQPPLDLLIILPFVTPMAAVLFGIGPVLMGLLAEPADLLREE